MGERVEPVPDVQIL